jgi:hypothetical protein
MINFILYISKIFFVLIFGYICVIIYTKYSEKIFEKIGYSKKNLVKKDILENNKNNLSILKDKFGIKSTEKTTNKLIFNNIVDLPNYFKYNIYNETDENKNINIDSDNLKIYDKHINNNNFIKKTVLTYSYNKLLYKNLFLDENDNCKIKNLKEFYELQKKHISEQVKIDYNILLKFYNQIGEYIYIFVDNNNLIKIIKHEEYDKISKLLEDSGIFIVKDSKKNINYITYGGFIESKIDLEEIKEFFFNKKTFKNNKNFTLLQNFKYIKIFFYVSTRIND